MSKTVEYQAYRSAKKRCSHPNATQKELYEGVEFRFESFEQFLAEVGMRPSPNHSIDRIGAANGGSIHYEPGNIRWATAKEQQRNRRVNVRYEFRGQDLTVPEIAEITGVNRRMLQSRVHYGWDIERAVTEPSLVESSKREYRGTMYSIADLAKMAADGITVEHVTNRLACGMNVEQAITQPVRPKNRVLFVCGEHLTVKECVARFGVNHNTLHQRLFDGWSDEDAVLTPRGSKVKYSKMVKKEDQ
jgi:hypothetical protein